MKTTTGPLEREGTPGRGAYTRLVEWAVDAMRTLTGRHRAQTQVAVYADPRQRAEHPAHASLLRRRAFLSRLIKGPSPAILESAAQLCEVVEHERGNLLDLSLVAPRELHDAGFVRRLTISPRRFASSDAAVELLRMNTHVDSRPVFPATICVPTLVMHRTGDFDAHFKQAGWLAMQIPARFAELSGGAHPAWIGAERVVPDEIGRLVPGVRPMRDDDRVLATILFADIVHSTEHLARVGDEAWRNLLARYHALVRRELAPFHGHEVDTAGDGFFATFNGPARAVRCALSIHDAARKLGIVVRAGVHTGEIELDGDSVTGIAVHIGARVSALAGANETLVSSTVKDLVSGSGLRFEDRGAHVLKGVPGEWRLYAAS